MNIWMKRTGLVVFASAMALTGLGYQAQAQSDNQAVIQQVNQIEKLRITNKITF
jgi:hypothetical protein